MKRNVLALAISIFFTTVVYSQSQPDAAFIKHKLKKLNVLASVLYVAAHPDDENTRLITYYANDQLATTAYLSMTRGDGGQNLIGSEIRDLLGLIRTQELIAARNVDFGHQFFTRANDFGFSKSAQETFRLWGKDEILSDVVRIYRQFQPDIIITRFPPDERAGHGHHTASAILAQEAFDVAADEKAYTTLGLPVWKAKRLFTNTGRWWNNTIDGNESGVLTINVGGYNTLLGTSYSEIAALSRSQHKSQGFGSSGTRGDQLEYLEFVKGDGAKAHAFEGVNTTWTRVKGGEKIQPLVERAIREYSVDEPSNSVPLLLQIRKQILGLEASVWRSRKLAEVEELIQDCLGLYVAANATTYYASPSKPVSSTLELINRSKQEVSVVQIQSSALTYDTTLTLPLKNNIQQQLKVQRSVVANASYSDPYWLQKPHGIGIFNVEDDALIGKPEGNAAISFLVDLVIKGERMRIVVPLRYRWTDPAKGELYRPVEIVPAVFVNVNQSILIFKDNQPQDIQITLKSALHGKTEGVLKLHVPEGWKISPEQYQVQLSYQHEEVSRVFTVTPSTEEGTHVLSATFLHDGKSYNQGVTTIAYDHIKTQTLLPSAVCKAVKLDLKTEGKVVGYIKGAGDDVPLALRTMGYDVIDLTAADVVSVDALKRFDAIVLGVRALNTTERIEYAMPTLLAYVQEGGTLITQYNTNGEFKAKNFSPYPITLSRDRVTEEDAEVRFLNPDHIVLNHPNKITKRDFEGWVQERGLYFPSSWDKQFDAILSMNDTGESAKDGSLLVANYGKGYYVYTGLSFFRELPEGVAGAYKLFANLVSLKQTPQSIPTSLEVKGKKKKQ
jgi:LmbE family N-acetylglucosaminyl deacetylase